jgi:thioredoxin-related protein
LGWYSIILNTLTHSYRVHGFPTFLIKSSNGKGIMLRGYQQFDTFKAMIDQITNGELAPENQIK